MMRTIKLLKPEHRSQKEEQQVFLWPHAAESARLAPEKTLAQPAFSYFFCWEPIDSIAKNIIYTLVLAQDREFTKPVFHGNIFSPEGTLPKTNILNLEIGTRYYWKVLAKDPDRIVGISPARFFRTSPTPPRWVHVPEIYNVRDTGGWPLSKKLRIRQGLIYRSSELDGKSWKLTPEGKRILIEDLGIRTDLDLRESNGKARPVLDQSMVKWLNVPVKAYHILENTTLAGYRKVFKIFADASSYPIIFHCQGGCDRGGTVSFLLHSLLGLSREDLIRDYELSSRAASRKEFQTLLDSLGSFGGRRESLKMQTEKYLRTIGVGNSDISAIRHHLIERSPSIS